VIGVLMGKEVPVYFMATLTGKNITLRSGIVSPQYYIPELLPMIEQGRLDSTEIIAQRISLNEGDKGYGVFDSHEQMRLKLS